MLVFTIRRAQGKRSQRHMALCRELRLLFSLVLLCVASLAIAMSQAKLLNVEIQAGTGNSAQITLQFSTTPPTPEQFSMETPSKMIFDFAGVEHELPANKATQHLHAGVITGINVVANEEQTRLIADVSDIVPYVVNVDSSTNIMTIDLAAESINSVAVSPSEDLVPPANLLALDFRRADDGAGRVIIELADADIPIDFREEAGDIIVEFNNSRISERLQRRFDVSDFGTPIQAVAVKQIDNKVVMKIKTEGEFEKIAYQMGDNYIVEVRALSDTEKEQIKFRTFKFTGERISLHFQDIEIRAVLQLLADFTGINLVASDSVSGNVTLRLDNVPWDQALDFILKSKGLGKRESGNIILIAPAAEIASREQIELEAMQQVESLTPLRSEFIQINYAKAADLMDMLKSDKSTMLSVRGVITIDERTNTLLIKDTADRLADIKSLITKLDVPVRQVLIEAQIVETDDDFSDTFGLKFGGAFRKLVSGHRIGIGSTLANAQSIADTNAITRNNTGLFFDSTSNFDDVPIHGIMGVSLAKLPGGILLDLELRASELESKTKVLSRPKLMTLDQQTAAIESGTEVAFPVTAQIGATPTVTFKKAVLRLEVTPQITPNNQVMMSLSVNQDKVGADRNDQATISTVNMQTNVLVENAETIVLGGLYTINQAKVHQKVPFFGDIPLIGKLFNSNTMQDNRREVLIFVTPKIVKPIFVADK